MFVAGQSSGDQQGVVSGRLPAAPRDRSAPEPQRPHGHDRQGSAGQVRTQSRRRPHRHLVCHYIIH